MEDSSHSEQYTFLQGTKVAVIFNTGKNIPYSNRGIYCTKYRKCEMIVQSFLIDSNFNKGDMECPRWNFHLISLHQTCVILSLKP